MNNERVSRKRLVGVYEPCTPSDCQPDRYTDIDDAMRLVNNRDAHKINRGKAIRLLRCSAGDYVSSTSPRDLCALGIADMEALAGTRELSRRRRERLKGWRFLGGIG
jgi:hypothetical protein